MSRTYSISNHRFLAASKLLETGWVEGWLCGGDTHEEMGRIGSSEVLVCILASRKRKLE